MSNPFRYFNSSPEVIRLVVMMYVRYPLSLRNVEDLLAERGIDISHETVRFWWNRFGPMFAAEIRKRRLVEDGTHRRSRGLPGGAEGILRREIGNAGRPRPSPSPLHSSTAPESSRSPAARASPRQ